jgi:hypothetical protein
MEQALEDVGAFSELRRGCEGLCKAASRARRSRGAFAALDETNSANAGVVPKRNYPFPFLRRKVQVRGMVDGIGGQMVLARQKKAIAGRPHGTGTQKKASGRGRAKLNAAADKTLEKNSEKIALSLLESTLGGNASSAKLLFALADGQIDCEDEGMVRRLYSLAEKLAAEPEWDGEAHGAVLEISSERHKPKG